MSFIDQRTYLGLTGILTDKEIKDITSTFFGGKEQFDPTLCLKAAVMMTWKTMNGIPSRWSVAVPKNEDVAGIFSEIPHVLNAIHYADYEGIDVLDSLRKVRKFGGPHLHAVQLDMIWPDPEVVRAFHGENRRLRIILQVGKEALLQAHNDPRRVIARMEKYGSSVTDVLIDTSGGRGEPFDYMGIYRFISSLTERGQHRVGVAGGLRPLSFGLDEPIESLVREFPRLSIDAQSGLRRSGNALDPIDSGYAVAYLDYANRMYRRHKR